MALAAEIARQKGSQKASEVKELVLDKCSVSKLAGNEFDGFVNLETLSLNSVGLTTLENFPSLMRLKVLELNDNKISGGLDVLQDLSLISLTVLSLGNNRLRALEDLEPLGGLPNLKQLDLEHCEVTSSEGYRAKVFEMIPQLKVLDHADVNGDPADFDEDEDDEDGEEDDDDDDLDGDDGDGDADDDEGEEGDDFDEEGQEGEEDAAEGEGESEGEEGDDEEAGEGDEEDDEEEGEEDDEPAAGKRPRLG